LRRQLKAYRRYLRAGAFADVQQGIAVLRDGRLEQVGAPRELYERPANDFVMGFLGPVSRLDGQLVRPHDLIVLDRPEGGAVEAMVARVVHLGFEVRVELLPAGGEPITAQLTRAEAEALELRNGDIVYVRILEESVPAPTAQRVTQASGSCASLVTAAGS